MLFRSHKFDPKNSPFYAEDPKVKPLTETSLEAGIKAFRESFGDQWDRVGICALALNEIRYRIGKNNNQNSEMQQLFANALAGLDQSGNPVEEEAAKRPRAPQAAKKYDAEFGVTHVRPSHVQSEKKRKRGESKKDKKKKAKKNEQLEGHVNGKASSVPEGEQQTSNENVDENLEKRRAAVMKIIKKNVKIFDTDKVGDLDGTVKLMRHKQVQKCCVTFDLGGNGKRPILIKRLREYLGYC